MAKKTKGLSFDEKKSVLAKAMQREGLFYNLKELEVLGKKNGVIPQAVKEVVDCLIAERVIIQEKIGSLNMYVIFSPTKLFHGIDSGPSQSANRKFSNLRLRPSQPGFKK